MRLDLFCFFLLFRSVFGSVILSGGPYCLNTTDGGSVQHAVPGTVISITCTVHNPSSGAIVLTWTIPSHGVTVTNVNGSNGADAHKPDFNSTVNSFDITGRTINATLTFTAVLELDVAVVNCADGSYIGSTSERSNCTLYILTPPSQPLAVISSNVTYKSLALVWSPPADNGGEPVSHYNITRTPGGRTLLTTTRSIVETNLEPRTNYSFLITACNSQGFGNYTAYTCYTPGEVFKSIPETDVNICLNNNEKSYLSIEISKDCPPSSHDEATTPPFDNFTITVSGFAPVYNSCIFNQLISAEKEYDITITVNNQLGPSEPTTKHFDSHWIRNINSYADLLNYSIPNCTTVKDASVTLSIAESNNLAVPVLTKKQPYDSHHTSFNISSLSSSVSYNYTLLVIRPEGYTLAAYTGGLHSTTNPVSTSTFSVTVTAISAVLFTLIVIVIIALVLYSIRYYKKRKSRSDLIPLIEKEPTDQSQRPENAPDQDTTQTQQIRKGPARPLIPPHSYQRVEYDEI